jgi:hypothetical protein
LLMTGASARALPDHPGATRKHQTVMFIPNAATLNSRASALVLWPYQATPTSPFGENLAFANCARKSLLQSRRRQKCHSDKSAPWPVSFSKTETATFRLAVGIERVQTRILKPPRRPGALPILPAHLRLMAASGFLF